MTGGYANLADVADDREDTGTRDPSQHPAIKNPKKSHEKPLRRVSSRHHCRYPGLKKRIGARMKTQGKNHSVNVLIVEDSRTQAEYLQHILENEGYTVVLATNGIEALEKVKIGEPSIILTDIVMPEMDGYELCRVIKTDENLRHIPVIIVTQLFDPADLVKGLDAGANNIIIKPYEPKHVISRIQNTLQLDDADSTLEVSFDGKTHTIPAHKLRTPALLLSTLDNALKKNTELSEANELLAAVNRDLQQKFERHKAISKTLQSSQQSDTRGTDTPSRGQESPGIHDAGRKHPQYDEIMRMVVGHLPFPLSLIDASGKFRFMNTKFEQLFGYTIEDIPSEKEWFSKAFRDTPESKNFISLWKRTLEGAGAKDSSTFPVTCKNGNICQISIHVTPLTGDERCVVFEDVTGKLKSDRLRFFLASIVSSSHDAIIGKSLDGTILSWNRAAERYYGYLAEEVVGKSIAIIIPPELHIHLPLFLQRIANGEIIDRFNTVRVRKDGSRINVCVTLSPIRDEGGRVIGVSTIAQNVTHSKKNDLSNQAEDQADPHR
jgi:PAS domain S-box-containing protein